MTDKQKPSQFVYDEFNIKNADFYNVDFVCDNKVFLNPYEIEFLDHPVAQKATAVAIDFFETVRQHMLANDFKTAQQLFCQHLSEPRETCLGYSSFGVCGKGIRDMASYVLKEIYDDNALKHAIRRIEDIKLFVPNISNDRVSDIYTNVIRRVLLEYTKEQCRLHGQTLVKKETAMYWNDETHRWEKQKEFEQFFWSDGLPKLLVPKCFITNDTYNNNRFNRYELIPDFIYQELQKADSNIVRELKDGTKKITKKDMLAELSRRQVHLDKYAARKYVASHPDCLVHFRQVLFDQRARRRRKK